MTSHPYEYYIPGQRSCDVHKHSEMSVDKYNEILCKKGNTYDLYYSEFLHSCIFEYQYHHISSSKIKCSYVVNYNGFFICKVCQEELEEKVQKDVNLYIFDVLIDSSLQDYEKKEKLKPKCIQNIVRNSVTSFFDKSAENLGIDVEFKQNVIQKTLDLKEYAFIHDIIMHSENPNENLLKLKEGMVIPVRLIFEDSNSQFFQDFYGDGKNLVSLLSSKDGISEGLMLLSKDEFNGLINCIDESNLLFSHSYQHKISDGFGYTVYYVTVDKSKK
jgi:hypothetical protein